MRTKGLICALLLLAVATVGCAYERKVATSSAEPPWVLVKPANTDERVMYVGEGLGDNILDTREARSRAMQNVRTQIAESLETIVVEQAVEIVEQKGAAHLGQDKERATYSRQVEQKVDQALAGVEQQGFYWEKWKIKEGFFSGSYSQYKYFVLAGMPRELYDKLLTELSHQIADSIEARGR
jgi:hypothetical protein